MTDRRGKRMPVWAYGLDKISETVEPVDLSAVRDQFKHVPSSAFKMLKARPVDILLGITYFTLHPFGGDEINKVKDLRAMRSHFGTGWVIAGAHPKDKTSPLSITDTARAIASLVQVGVLPNNMVSLQPPPDPS